jgi:uncharacterized membrane protein
VLLLLAAACSAPPADTADPCASVAVSWEHGGAAFFAGYCRTCHAAGTPDRHGAPAGVDFDTLADVRTHAARIRARAIEAQDMPVGGGVPADELALLDDFLACGL